MLKKVNNRVMLSDWTYTVGKKLVLVVIPAISTLYFLLANLWGLPDAQKVIGSLAALATFLGTALHISSTQYDASGAAHDGTISLSPSDTGSVLAMQVDPSDVASKDAISLKVVPPPPASALPQPPEATPQTPLPPSKSS